MVTFNINDKVAIISGGVSGIGFQCALQLLQNGARGVTLADVNSELGQEALQKIETQFGPKKAIFLKTDVTNYDQFEEAFKQTVKVFKNVDILINNAGMANDKMWQKEINLNINGVVHGMLLGLDNYISNYKSGTEGLILNISSVAGITSFPGLPVYGASKFAVHGMTLSWGLSSHYERTKVRVVGACPGVTMTPLVRDMAYKNLGPDYEKIRVKDFASIPSQTPEQIAPNVIKIIEKAPSGTIWVVEGGEEPYKFQLPDRFTMPKITLQ